MSTLKVSAIEHPTSGSAVSLNGTIPSNRNRIINGDMRIDQRNAGASVTPTNGQYSVDRWQASLSQASKFSVQRNAGSVTPPAGFINYLGATSLSAYTVGASELFLLSQLIEGFNTADLAWGTSSAEQVTLSFWIRSSLTGTFGGSLGNNAGDRNYPFSYTISAANTWERKTINISGDTSGTWLTDNSCGIRLNFSLGTGSSRSATAGSWTGTSGIYSSTGATSVVGTNGATFYITGVQLEAGSVATPFERRQYGQELALCQRYYEAGSHWSQFGAGYGSSGGQNIGFRVSKRATPTVTATSTSGGGFTVVGPYVESFSFYMDGTATGIRSFNWTAAIEL